MAIDLDRWIEKIKNCDVLTELELQSLCEYVRNPLPFLLYQLILGERNSR